MQWFNNRQGYGWVAIALHWLAAIAVITMLWSGWILDDAGEAGDRATHRLLLAQHISLGMTFILLLLARVVAHYAMARPAPLEQNRPLRLAAFSVHHLLLFAILLQIVTGPLITWAIGRPILVWDWFSIPSPFPQPNRGLHEFFETVHKLSRWPTIILISVHALAALKHAMIDRDGVLRRMLIAGPPKP